MDKKEVLKFVVCGVICLLLGARIGNVGKVSSKEYNSLKDRYNYQVNHNTELKSEKETIEKELSDLKEKTKSYVELNETEKSVVDTKIQEVKRLTKEKAEAEQKRIAEEQAQKAAEEQAKREAEEQAKKEEEERKKEEEERKKAEEQAKREAEEQAKREAEAHKYETGLTWEQIAREGKKGTLGQFEGKIIQVMNGNGFTQYRVTINGNYDEVMLIEVKNGVAKETLLEDDYVYFKGESLGTITYTTVMGAEMTVPAFECHEITR